MDTAVDCIKIRSGFYVPKGQPAEAIMVDPENANLWPAPARVQLILPQVQLQDLPATAKALLGALPAGYSVVCFEGPMGSGKTTLIKQLCQALGVHEPVTSPTYALVNEYEGEAGKRICHFDFYRIRNEQEAMDIGIGEYFNSGDLCLVEWPSLVPSLLPDRYARVQLEITQPEARTITLFTY